MIDPPRYLDGAGGRLARELLASALHDAGSAAAHRRVQALVGSSIAFGVVAEAGTATAAVTAAKGAATPLALAKWIGVGALAGTLVAGATVVVTDPVHSRAPSTVQVAPPRAVHAVAQRIAPLAQDNAEPAEPSPPAPELVPRGKVPVALHAVDRSSFPTVGAPVQAESPPDRAAGTAALPPPGSVKTLAEEVALVDAIRAALARSDTTTAFAEIARHDGDFASGPLALDVAVLRVRALFMAGRRAAGEREAARLLAANPKGPYATRVREMLDGTNP